MHRRAKKFGVHCSRVSFPIAPISTSSPTFFLTICYSHPVQDFYVVTVKRSTNVWFSAFFWLLSLSWLIVVSHPCTFPQFYPRLILMLWFSCSPYCFYLHRIVSYENLAHHLVVRDHLMSIDTSVTLFFTPEDCLYYCFWKSPAWF